MSYKSLRLSLLSIFALLAAIAARADLPITATWDFTNSEVVAAVVAFSGETEAGTIENNGLSLTVEANGQTIRDNGNSIQTGDPVVFKVPVQGKKDVVTVVGYSAPYFAYSIAGTDATEATTQYTATAADVAQGYVEIVNKGQYLISISVIQNEDDTPSFPISATWDFTNADCVAAVVAFSGETEAGTIENNGLSLTVEANGQTIRDNGNSIQTGDPVVFKVPVQGKKDEVTVVGYPGYFAYSIAGTDATEATTKYTATAADVAQGYVEIVSKGLYIISISVTQNEDDGSEEPVSQDVTGTWTYSNGDVMTATMALSGSTTSGEVEAAEKNGLMMTVEANGASFRNNGNNIQVRKGAVFKIPVKNAGDLITIKGYPGYSYYIVGNSAKEQKNDTTFKAKLSDAEAGYVTVTSNNDNNYFYSLSVVQYAPKEKTTLDNEAVTITFPFNDGTEGQKATFSNADYFLSSKVTYGSNLTLKDKKTLTDAALSTDVNTVTVDQTRFEPADKLNSAGEPSAVRFTFVPKPGFTFTPTKVSFEVTRYGTDNGLVDVAWENTEGKKTLATEVKPNRDNANPNISKLSYDITDATAAGEKNSLLLYLYSLQAAKQFGLDNIVIEGTLSGTEADMPVLTSFNVNGNTYTVEEVFDEEYEATLELPKAQAMVSAANPLTDLEAASGEIGEVTYNETSETTCTVTIPMFAGETQMDYVLNVVYKPDFTLSYIAVDGTTVLQTQIVEKDSKIGEFAYDIENVSSLRNGYKARGWFKQNSLGEKFTTDDVITADTKLYAIETEIEVASDSRKYVFNLTDKFLYPEDHEAFNPTGSYHWYNAQHGFIFFDGDKVDLLVGKKATINISLCQYGWGTSIDASNGVSVAGISESDGGIVSIDYEGEPGILTLTMHTTNNKEMYIHSITIFNTSETNYDRQGDWIIVKKGDASSLLDAIEVAKGVEGMKIFVPDGTYDLGETVKTTIGGKRVSIIGQSAENTIIMNRPPLSMEGLAKADLLQNTSEELYMQDITLKNDLPYDPSKDGRAPALHDTGTKTICKNVNLMAFQDTYYSHKVGGLYYFEGGELHGCVDYLCGNGKVYYNKVKLVNESVKSTHITANSELYVFNNCFVQNDSPSYDWGRAWSDNPVCVFLNTTLSDRGTKMIGTRWGLNGINCDYSVAGEYGTKNIDGNDITPASNNITFSKMGTAMNTILDASALETYSIENVLGDWATEAQQSVKQVEAPAAVYENGVVSWVPANNGAIAYALFKNGEFVGLTEGSSIEVEANEEDELTIRAANARGGFGEPVEVTVATSVDTVASVATVDNNAPAYNVAGQRVSSNYNGLIIQGGIKRMK
ncbi:MAG: hypothetical protein IKQ68_08715 [Prevotella sp.]|nr:hypothetical protein [Prevotella sp.]